MLERTTAQTLWWVLGHPVSVAVISSLLVAAVIVASAVAAGQATVGGTSTTVTQQRFGSCPQRAHRGDHHRQLPQPMPGSTSPPAGTGLVELTIGGPSHRPRFRDAHCRGDGQRAGRHLHGTRLRNRPAGHGVLVVDQRRLHRLKSFDEASPCQAHRSRVWKCACRNCLRCAACYRSGEFCTTFPSAFTGEWFPQGGGMFRRFAISMAVVLGVAFAPAVALADMAPSNDQFSPGSAGIGDPYFPLDGNGGYDVSHYDLDVRYQPGANLLSGLAVIQAHATQNLSQFNLDLRGLTVRSVKVNGATATWARDGDELVITPARGVRDRHALTTEIRYDGNPQPNDSGDGFIPTDDGALVIGEPHVASSWFPVNDHPSDKASYDIQITVPQGLEAISNGILVDTQTKNNWTTWKWRAKEPMASYLATATVGQFDVHSYRSKGYFLRRRLRSRPVRTSCRADHRGQPADLASGRLELQTADPNHQRPGSRRATVVLGHPRDRAAMGLHVRRGPHGRARRLDHASRRPTVTPAQDVGFSCPGWLSIHPFFTHYQTGNPDGTCTPSGTSGSGRQQQAGATDPNNGRWTCPRTQVRTSRSPSAMSATKSSRESGVFIDDITRFHGCRQHLIRS